MVNSLLKLIVIITIIRILLLFWRQYMLKKLLEKLFAPESKRSFNEPRIIKGKSKRALKKYGGSKKLIAPPAIYAEVMRMIPEGKVATKDLIREYLAKKYNVDYVDILTSEIYINIVANESFADKIEEVPYWRTLDMNGKLNPKYPGGLEGHKRMLEKEGHNIIKKDKFYYVDDYCNKLFKFSDWE